MLGKKFLHLNLSQIIIRLLLIYTVVSLPYDIWKELHKKDIHQAAASGDIERVKELLPKTKPDELVRTDGRGTVLHVAVMKGHIEVARMLLNYGLDVDALNDLGQSPLYSAVNHNRDDIATMLLDHGAYLNRIDAFGFTPLFNAAQSNAVACIELLAGRGADLNYAVSSVNHKLLTSVRFIPPEQSAGFRDRLKGGVGMTPLLLAASAGHVDAVQCLLKLGSNVHAATPSGETALFPAAQSGNVECSKTLIDHGADVNATVFVDASDNVGAAPLHVSVEGGYQDLVGLLLSHGADVNQQSIAGTPLYIAQQQGQEDVIQTLQAYDAVAVSGNF